MDNLVSFFTENKSSKNSNQDSNSNDHKNHYFIGNVINDEMLIEKIKLTRKKLIDKYKIKELHFPNIISTNLIYLGYLTKEVANMYMNKIISFLCTSITKKFDKMECNLTNFKLKFDKTYYKIMLQLEDNNNYLKKYIIPYLQKNGIEKIYGNRNYETKASIDVLYFKKSDKIETQKQKYKKNFKIILDFPIDKFIISNLSLIKGTPLVSRSGYPSVHDQMEYEVVKNYNFDFKGSMNNLSKNQNQNQNQGSMNNLSKNQNQNQNQNKGSMNNLSKNQNQNPNQGSNQNQNPNQGSNQNQNPNQGSNPNQNQGQNNLKNYELLNNRNNQNPNNLGNN